MKIKEIEALHKALKNPNLELRVLPLEDFIVVMRTLKEINEVISDLQTNIKALIASYNKDEILVKKEENGSISGPKEFVDKFTMLLEKNADIKIPRLKDTYALKTFIEKLPIEEQLIIFDVFSEI